MGEVALSYYCMLPVGMVNNPYSIHPYVSISKPSWQGGVKAHPSPSHENDAHLNSLHVACGSCSTGGISSLLDGVSMQGAAGAV